MQNIALMNFVLNNVHEAAYLIGEDAHFHFVNDESCRILGYSRDELLNLSVPEIDPDFQMESWFDHWNKLKTQHSLTFESCHQTKDGHLFPVEINANYFEYNGLGYNLALVRDITERNQTENALRESETRYRQLLDSVTDYIYTVQIQNGIPVATVHGPGCVAVTGYTAEEYAMDEYLWYRMIYQPDQSAVVNQVARILAGETALPLEHRIIHRDGSLRWVRNTPVSHDNQQRQLIAYDGLISDITERKQAENALRASEEKYRVIFEESFDGLFITSATGKILDMNKKGILMFGYDTKEEILNLDLERDVYAYPLDRKRIIDKVNEQGTVEYEVVVKKKSGVQMVAFCSLTAVRDELGVIATYRGIIRDITEQKKTDEQMRYQAALLTNVSDAIIASNENYELTAWNAAAESLYGWKADEVIGRQGLAVIQTDFPEKEKDEMLHVITTAGKWRGEVTQVRKDGKRIPVEISSIVLHDENDRVTGFVSVNRDITERKRVEEEHLAHLHFFESMDQINQSLQSAVDLEQMMGNVLDVVLSIFACDRAFLMYPCDPEAATWRVTMKRFRPEYPVVLASGPDVPMDAELASLLRTLLDTDGPVKSAPRTGFALPSDGSKRFGFKSFMSMALYPKTGKPWHFGIHQCSYSRTWTLEEERLFQEIGRRLADGLSSLLAYRNLQDSELRYREIFNNISEGLYLLEVTEDGRFRILEENPSMARSLGISLDGVVGKFVDELQPEAASQAALAMYRRCVEAGTITEENVELDLPFGKRYYSSSFIPLRDPNGRIHRIIGIARDFTERKQAEESLRESEQKYREIFDNVSDSLFVFDVIDGDRFRFTSINPTAERISGVSNAAAHGKYFEDIVWPEQVARSLPYFRRCVEEGKQLRYEEEYSRPGDIQRFLDTILIPVRSIAGRIHRLIMVNRDITVQKNYYEEKQRRNRELEILAQLSSALRRTVTQDEMALILLQKTIVALEAVGGIMILIPNFETSPLVYQQGRDTGELVHLFKPGSDFWDQANSQPFWFSSVPSIEGTLVPPDDDVSTVSLGQKFVVCARMISANSFIGLLVLGYSDQHKPSSFEQRLFVSIAEIGGNALHRSGIMSMLEKRVADRTVELKTLYDISIITSLPLKLNLMLEEILWKTSTTVRAQAAVIYQMDAENKNLRMSAQVNISPGIFPAIQTIPLSNKIKGWLNDRNEPLIISQRDDINPPLLPPITGYHSFVHIPIQVEGKALGEVSFMWESFQELTAENIALLSTVARRLAAAIQNDDLQKRSEKAAVLEERHRLAGELHDSVSQLLYALTLQTEAGKEYLKAGSVQRLEQCLDDLGTIALQALKEMRLLLYELRSSPASLEGEGLETALRCRLENVEKRAGVQVKFLAEGSINNLSPGDQNELFFIAAEALNNSLKHSKSSFIDIKIQSSNDFIKLEICDNGIGFDVSQPTESSLGLRNMRDRAMRLKGELTITSSPGQGTCVRVEMPLSGQSLTQEEHDGK